jgi:hypothetical protein
LRWLGALFSSLTMLCLVCTPALAQSSPSASQYPGGGSGYCPPGNLCVQSVNDGADAFSENAKQGTDAVNDAMAEPEASAPTVPDDASAPAVLSDASAPAGSVSPGGGTAGSETGGPGGITKLPETGGPFVVMPGLGVLLVALGLTSRKICRR